MSRKSAIFVDVPTILQKCISKGSERKIKKLVRLVIQITDIRNVHLGNILDVDLNITYLLNVRSQLNRMINGEIKYVSMKKLIVHVTTAKISIIKMYMHIWHVCLIITNVSVRSPVTVRN